MKVVIIGGSGRIGRPLDELLVAAGHETVVASPSRGVDAVSGRGLEEALRGADVVVDVSDSPSFEEEAVMAYFTTATRNLLAQARMVGVKHHVALSIVGTERAQDSAYYRAKLAQETLIQDAGVPYTIVRATQFFEFLQLIADGFTIDGQVRVPDARLQPIAAADVVLAIAAVVEEDPLNGRVEVAGPQTFAVDELMRQVLTAAKDDRPIVVDRSARYFGTPLDDKTLTAGAGARIGDISLNAWMNGMNVV